jgi:DNA-binding MarR family transcriptional regulator
MGRLMDRSAGLTKQERIEYIENIARVLMQLSWVAQKQFALSVAQHDLTFPQFLTLAFVIRAAPYCSMNQIAEATHQDAATMTGVVDRLERLGLVVRGRSPQDRRVVLVQATPDGMATVSAVKQSRDHMMTSLFAPFGDDMLQHLHGHLEALWQAFETQAKNGNGSSNSSYC